MQFVSDLISRPFELSAVTKAALFMGGLGLLALGVGTVLRGTTETVHLITGRELVTEDLDEDGDAEMDE